MGRRILVVDDEAVARKVAGALLLHHGYEVLYASSTQDGFLLAARHRPDAILLDIMFPGEDGGSLAQRLAEHGLTEGIPIIFLSSLVDAPEVRGARAEGAPYLLPKPLVAAELLALLDRILGEER